MYQHQTSKTLFILVSVIGSAITLPFVCWIVHFERNKDNRTLLNQLVSSLFSKTIAFIVIISPIDLAFYTIGPLPEALCLIECWLRTSSTMISILTFDSIFVVRYLFVFHLKNPTATQDDFWMRFLNLWTLAAGSITQGRESLLLL